MGRYTMFMDQKPQGSADSISWIDVHIRCNHSNSLSRLAGNRWAVSKIYMEMQGVRTAKPFRKGTGLQWSYKNHGTGIYINVTGQGKRIPQLHQMLFVKGIFSMGKRQPFYNGAETSRTGNPCGKKWPLTLTAHHVQKVTWNGPQT